MEGGGAIIVEALKSLLSSYSVSASTLSQWNNK